MLFATGTAAHAKPDSSLEQTYTSMCAGKPDPETEACAALKKALVAKLSVETTKSESKSREGQPDSALSQVELRRRWGLYAHLAGKRYLTNFMGGRSITSFAWEVPGQVLVSRTDNATKTGALLNDPCCPPLFTKYRWNADLNAIVTEGAGGGFTMRAAADGSFEQPPEQKGKYGVFRSRTWLNSNGSWTSVSEKLKNGIWKEAYRSESYEMTPQFMASLRGDSSSGGGGFMDALGIGLGAAIVTGNIEAGVTAAGQAASGANAYEIMSGMADSVQRSGAAGVSAGSIAGAMSGGMTAGPDLLAGSSACAGMNESNYREVGLSAGNSQMKTQCAMAYEHYNNYKKAIEQGYSDADVQRAYEVYQKNVMYVNSVDEQIRSDGGGIHVDGTGPSAPRAPVTSSPPPADNGPAVECQRAGSGACVTPQ